MTIVVTRRTGVVTIVTTATASCSEETLGTLLARWAVPRFIIFACCHVSVLAVLNVYVSRVERRMVREFEGSKVRAALALGPGVCAWRVGNLGARVPRHVLSIRLDASARATRKRTRARALFATLTRPP